MITSPQTNSLYFSENLKLWHPEFFEELEHILEKHNIHFSLLKGTADIWCRDYMPLQLSADEFLWFWFQPDYYGKKLAQKVTRQLGLQEQIKGRHYYSDLVLDGGNLVNSGHKAILTEKVLKDNPGNTRQEIIDQLMYELRLDKVILIPKQPYDWTGQADGMMRFVDENRLFVNDFIKESPSWKARLARALRNQGLEIITFPYVYTEERNQYDELTAKGCYINFLQVGNLIVLPQFGFPGDAMAVKVTRKYFPDCTIETIDCNAIAHEGGVLNCISWCIKCK
jgi:agmatine deiminase